METRLVTYIGQFLLFFAHFASCSEAQGRLIKELFLSRNYDKLSRPVTPINNISQTVHIQFGITLNILVFVSDKDQVMKSNGYLELGWVDQRLTWNPPQYGDIGVLRLPVDKIWQPDIALTNTVDEHFGPNYKSNVLIYSDGNILWVPPFIFKSGCDTNPHYFPFDKQQCLMVFRSVTYNANEVEMDLSREKMELKDYKEQPSGTWDITDVPLVKMYRIIYRPSGHNTPDVSVQLDLTVRRKSKFYVLTFLLPCVCIAFLTIFVFYLPTASGEKLCLAISILFSIVIFLLILIDILPPSDSLPLMTKFLVFTFVCNLTSVIITTISVNFNYRTPKTYKMSRWIRAVFLETLPKYLRMRRPKKPSKKKLFQPTVPRTTASSPRSSQKQRGPTDLRQSSVRFAMQEEPAQELVPQEPPKSPIKALRFPSYSSICATNSGFSISRDSNHSAVLRELQHFGDYLEQFPGYQDALGNVAFIAKNMEDQDEEGDATDDWKYIALVIDRLLLWVFFIGNAVGSASILLNSPELFRPLAKP